MNKRQRPDVETIKRLLSYDPATGILRWKVTKGAVRAGNWAGCPNFEGYTILKVNGYCTYGHRVAWVIHFGEWPDGQIDHVDGNKSNNAIENLRIASIAENAWNMPVSKQSKTGFKGVTVDRGSGLYAAKIRYTINGVTKFESLGKFDTPEEAAHAYNKAAIIRHGEFARLNPVGGNYAR